MSRPSVNACSTMSGTSLARGQLDQRAQVVEARVHAAVRDEPEQVQPPAVAPGRAARAAPRSRRTSRPRSRRRCAVRSCCTTAPAPRFRWPTSELPIWPSGSPTARPAGGRAACADSAPRARRTPACRPARRRCPGPAGASPQPSSTTRQTDGTGGCPAHRQVMRRRGDDLARSPSGSRLAPPTSAPSTSGWARISAALSGLTLPP